MKDEKEGPAEPAWMKKARREDALRRKVLRLEHEWLLQRAPAALLREWQRHCVAVEIMSGLLAASEIVKMDTPEELKAGISERAGARLAEIAYGLAEQMMQRREQLKAADGAKPTMVSTHGEIAVDLYREHAKEPAK